MNKKHFFVAVILVLLFVIGLLPVLAGLPPELRIDIDIKPYSYPNSINLGSNGVVPVAIISSYLYDENGDPVIDENGNHVFVDATGANYNSVSLSGVTVAMRGNGCYKAHEEDVNRDGFMDLVVQVESTNLDVTDIQDGYATLYCQIDGVLYWGEDEIKLVPPQ